MYKPFVFDQILFDGVSPDGATNACKVIHLKNEFKENINANAIAQRAVFIENTFEEHIYGDSDIGKIIFISNEFEEEICDKDYVWVGAPIDERVNSSINHMSKTIYAEQSFAENINGRPLLARLLGAGSGITENISCAANLEKFISAGGKVAESIQSSLTLKLIINIKHEITEEINGEITPSKRIYVAQNFEETINSNAALSAVINIKINVNENIDAEPRMGKTMSVAQDFEERILSFLTIGQLDASNFIVDITIPPNYELRIDSDNYLVYLVAPNGARTDVLDKYNGDWIFFDRDTIDIKIESLDGRAISSKVIYDNRYI